MTIDRAIEILNPEHREHYDGMDEVNEACRMGMEALERTRWIPCSERLPKDGEDVLCWYEYFRYGNYNRMFRTFGIGHQYYGTWSGETQRFWHGCHCPNRRRRCRGMSERQEHRQRLNARIAYAAAIERWAKNQPSRIRFFAVRRWLKEMPRKEDFYEAD